MSESVASTKALREALDLSVEMLRNIELSELPLAALCLKASRLARLIGDFNMQTLFEYEASGYPYVPEGISLDVYKLGQLAGREFHKNEDGKTKAYMYCHSVGELESNLAASQAALHTATDPDVSISSANPKQYVPAPVGNTLERNHLLSSIANITRKLSKTRGLVHRYVAEKHYELKFSGISSEVFSRIRERVDTSIGSLVPDATKKFTAVYDNLQSENSEDWSNAVHSCRRILQDLADALFPPQQDRTIKEKGKPKKIKMGPDQYINRLIAFVEENSTSDRYVDVVGSQLGFLGDRLDSIFRAAQKGSHDNIVDREEADRYVVYTYLVVGDILSLQEEPVKPAISDGIVELSESASERPAEAMKPKRTS